MSLKETLYNGIKTDLTDLDYVKADGTVDRLKHVALWRNQIAREREEIPFNYPAVFIEFLSSSYMESSSKAYQELTMTVRLHICFESYKDEDLDILRLTQAVYGKMQLAQYDTCGNMKRRNEEQDFDHSNVQDFMQDYDISKAHDYNVDRRPSTPATIDTLIITPEIVTET